MSLLPSLESAVVETTRRYDRRGPARRRRGLLLAAGAGGLAIAGTAAVLIIGVGSRGTLDVVSEARAALAPQAGILHIDLSISSKSFGHDKRLIPSVGQAAITEHVEQWSAKDPVRFRMLTHESKEQFPGTTRPVQERAEVSWGNRTQTTYQAENRSMLSVTKLSPRSSASHLPAIPQIDRSLDDIAALLADGQLTDRGQVTVGGRVLRRLAGRISRQVWRDGGTVDYDVDPKTFAPVQITTRTAIHIPAGAGERRSTMTSITTAIINRFDHLPLNASTAPLLEIHPPKGITIVSRTLGQERAYGRRLRAAQKARAKQMKASGDYRGPQLP